MRYTFIALLFFVSSITYACRCKEAGLDDSFKSSESVVLGKVLEVAPLSDYDGNISIIEVVRSWKKPISQTIGIMSITNCSFIFKKGRQYILFLKSDRYGLYYTDKCMGSRLVDENSNFIIRLNTLDELP